MIPISDSEKPKYAVKHDGKHLVGLYWFKCSINIDINFYLHYYFTSYVNLINVQISTIALWPRNNRY